MKKTVFIAAMVLMSSLQSNAASGVIVLLNCVDSSYNKLTVSYSDIKDGPALIVYRPEDGFHRPQAGYYIRDENVGMIKSNDLDEVVQAGKIPDAENQSELLISRLGSAVGGGSKYGFQFFVGSNPTVELECQKAK